MNTRSLARFLDTHVLVPEDERTEAVMERVRRARARGYLTKGEFLAICNWKSPRARRHFESNTHHDIRFATQLAMSRRSERVRFDALTALTGVSAPMASAILTLTDPRRYGVIDIRVWKLLYQLGSVTTRPSGVGFRYPHWHSYLEILRQHAKRIGAEVRAVERTLFAHHRRHSRGRLYRATS